jgi:hypothetical protein
MSATKAALVQKQSSAPHIAEIAGLLGGLGKTPDAMYDFHAKHRVKPQRGHGRHGAQRGVIRWCFADEELQPRFASEFAR